MPAQSKTVKVTCGDFSISSAWKCTFKYLPGKSYGSWQITTGPSCNSHTESFKWSIPSGAKIKKAQIWVEQGNNLYGAICRVNNVNFTEKSGNQKGANITLSGTSGTLSAKFEFKAYGQVKYDNKIHYNTCSFKGVYLWIEYTGGDGEGGGGGGGSSDGLQVPPQSVCIYDQGTGDVYLFDGVEKTQHSLSMKIEEEPEKHKDQYVNNARNEPDKVTLDVLMSDVYTGAGDIIDNAGSFTTSQQTAFSETKDYLIQRDKKDPWSRSENALYSLHALKEKRGRVSVITPHFVHVNMILSTVTITQDESTPYGWVGQLVFQRAYEAQKKTNTNSSSSSSGQGGRTPSGWYQSFGPIIP